MEKDHVSRGRVILNIVEPLPAGLLRDYLVAVEIVVVCYNHLHLYLHIEGFASVFGL